jgi:uncharacterized protein (TIGR04222 family)
MTTAVAVALIALLLPSVWLGLIRLKARGPRGPVDAVVPDLFGIAQLSEFPGRVADTVIAKMHADGRITVDDEGTVHVVRAAAHHPVERELLKACGTEWQAGLGEVHCAVRWGDAVEHVEGTLEKLGLMISPREQKEWQWAAGVQIAGLVMAGLVGTGLLLKRGAHWAPLTVLALVAAGIALRVVCHPRWWTLLTDHGQEAWDHLRYKTSWGDRDAADNPAGVAGVVAAWGVTEIQDDVLREQLEKAARWSPYRGSSSTASSSSSSCSSFSSSSCGGSDGSSSHHSCSSCSSCSSSSCSSSSCSS